MVMTTVAEVPAGLPVVDTAAIEEAAGEGVDGVLPGPPSDDPQPLSATSTAAATAPRTRAAILILQPPFAPIRPQPGHKRSSPRACASRREASPAPGGNPSQASLSTLRG